MQKRDEAQNSISKIPLLFLIYGVIGVLAGIILLFVVSMLAANEIVSENVLQSVPVIAVFVGSLISGYIAARSMGKALLTGLIQSVVNFAILYLLGVLVFMRIKPMGFYLYVFLACAAGAVLGGLLTAVGGRRHRRRNA